MADQTSPSSFEDLRRSIQEKERELSELDLILADYHSEHSRLVLELRRLWAKLRDEEQIASSVQSSEHRS